MPPEKLAGTIQNDILKEFMVRNTYIYPPDAVDAHRLRHLRLHRGAHAEIQLDLDLRLPHAGGRRDAGPRARLHARRRRRIRARWAQAGLDIDRFAPRLSFFWAIGMNFFMEVAKMRAARLLWAKLMKPFDPKDARSLSLRTHCQTSGWSLAAQDVFNNVVRTGDRGDGGDAGPHPVAAHQRARRGAGAADRLLRPHRPQHADRSCSRRAAPRASSIPWGGSFYVERLTSELAKTAWGHIQEVEELGGMAKAIEAGMPKLRIEEAAAKTQARIDAGQQAVIGVNKYRPETTSRRSTCSRSTTRRCGNCRSTSSRGSSASATQGGRGLAMRSPAAPPGQRQPAGARDRRRARQGDGRRDLLGAGAGLRPPPRRDQGDHRRL